MSHLYRNQFIDFHSKPIDWLLYEWDISLKWIKVHVTFSLTLSMALYDCT